MRAVDTAAVIMAATPVAGGAGVKEFRDEDTGDFFCVTHAPLDVARACATVGRDGAGAISTFVGTTRDHFKGRRVVRLEYEGYMPMAIKEMRKIAAQVRARWAVECVAMVHRLGLVPVGESSVIIAVSSAHRLEAVLATHFAIDTLKATVPIWKKEVYADGDGDAVWKENCEGCVRANAQARHHGTEWAGQHLHRDALAAPAPAPTQTARAE